MSVHEISIRTTGRTQMIDISSQVAKALKESQVREGLLVVYVPHTTAAVTINENADPSVQEDILSTLNRLIPLHGPYRHGEGNSAAHVQSTLVGSSQTILIEGGRLKLGTWQGIFFCEFDGPRTRNLWVKVIPDLSS